MIIHNNSLVQKISDFFQHLRKKTFFLFIILRIISDFIRKLNFNSFLKTFRRGSFQNYLRFRRDLVIFGIFLIFPSHFVMCTYPFFRFSYISLFQIFKRTCNSLTCAVEFEIFFFFHFLILASSSLSLFSRSFDICNRTSGTKGF